jgi:AraC-like DNA-binding protein
MYPAGLDPSTRSWCQSFLAHLAHPQSGFWSLFDRNPDILFVIKARDGRYVYVSESCVDRCGLTSKVDAIGKTVHDLFPIDLADGYKRQDEVVCWTGRPVIDSLELTLHRNREHGWCLSNKIPLHDQVGNIVGIACMDRDVPEAGVSHLIDLRFAETVAYIQTHFSQSQRIPHLARMAGLSPAQFDRRMHKVFGISTREFLVKVRVDAAAQDIALSGEPLSSIAVSCGFSDQSALSRHFRRFTGCTPRQYRKLMHGPANADRHGGSRGTVTFRPVERGWTSGGPGGLCAASEEQRAHQDGYARNRAFHLGTPRPGEAEAMGRGYRPSRVDRGDERGPTALSRSARGPDHDRAATRHPC